MNKPTYDKSSVKSIYEHALKLKGKTLAQVAPETVGIENVRNRGDLGTLVEKYYFAHTPKGNHGPDFPEAGLELKTSGVKRQKKKTVYAAKERLSLMMIDFTTLGSETWEKSSLLAKCRLMLIQFYDYVKDVPVTDRKFVLDPLLCLLCDINELEIDSRSVDWRFVASTAQKISDVDLLTIKRDWELIRQKVEDDKAHELSEGDTNYLKASRKGSGGDGEPLRKQLNSDAPDAKSRGFSIRQSFFTKLIEEHEASTNVLGITPVLSIEEATKLKFTPFIGMTVTELSQHFSFFKRDKNHKGFYSELAMRMLSGGGNSVPELDKADIKKKIIRVKRSKKTGKLQPIEAMSLRNFKYCELPNQKWEESVFFEDIERRFLFIVFLVDENKVEKFFGAFYWNMPYLARVEAELVWMKTKKQIVANKAHELPKSSESLVAHVRPHARNSKDTEATPQGEWLVKKSFWLNREYIAKIIAENIE